MTIFLGKRNLGAGTAASPGDSLYIPLTFYNDSGASISIGSTLAVTDIEVFKDGAVAQRATDSGYSILGDTGNFDNRIGFKGIKISLFNTADDASFYAVGSTYWVAIDSVTVDARTVRLIPAMFEIGENRANIVQIGGDTGAANYLKATFAGGFADTGIQNRLDKILSDTDTGIQSAVNVTQLRGDTGGADRWYRYTQKLDTGGDATVTSSVDTGVVNQAVWQANAARSITASSDTGLNERLGRIQSDVDTGLRTHIDDLDTGLANLNVNINQIRGDTGGADRFYRYTQKLDTGGDATVAASVDTGQVNQAVWQANALRQITVDTGIAFAVWQTATSTFNDDTGTFGELLRNPATATVDTGQVNQAVWQANALRQITVDTGIADQVWKTATAGYADDTGTFGELLRVPATASVDTGVVNQAVWQGNAARVLTANTNLSGLTVSVTAFSDTGVQNRLDKIASDTDTGIKDGVWDSATRTLTANTNLSGLQVNVTQIDSDTGAADQLAKAYLTTPTYFQQVNVVQIDSDTGSADVLAKATNGTGGVSFAAGINMNSSSDTGINDRLARILSDTDTGIKDGVWDSATRTLTANTNLSGLQVNVTQIDSDTGAADQLAKAFLTTPTYFQQVNVLQLGSDTGAANWLKQTYASGFSDTGLNERLARIQSDVDTGLRVHIDDSDTGLKDTIADLDTGLRGILSTNGVNVRMLVGDTGAASQLQQSFLTTPTYFQRVNVTQLGADTGAANYLRATFANGFSDTGIQERLARIQSDVDTGLRTHIDDLDTGLANLNVNINQINADTGAASQLRQAFATTPTYFQQVDVQQMDGDTGAADVLQKFADGAGALNPAGELDTGSVANSSYLPVNVIRLGGDTGASNWLKQTFASGFSDTGLNSRFGQVTVTGFSDTGINNRLAVIAADTDTGIQSSVNVTAFADTGVNARLSAVQTKTDSLTFTTAGQVDSNVQSVNDVTVNGAGTSANPWGP
jgi:hypothetical protein